MHRWIASLLALALIGGVAPSVEAYTTAKTTDGIDLRWDTEGPVPFRFHYRGSDDMDTLELEGLTRAAFATWVAVEDADLTIEEGRIYTGAAAHHDGPSEVDGQSQVFFVEGLWPFGTTVIALTSVSFAADGQILDADIAFNGADHTFTTSDTGGIKDFQSIATHEVGHFLGLAHPEPDVPSATMTAEYEDGETFLRDLDPDDAAGLAFLYPCGAPPCLGAVSWEAPGTGCSLGAEPIPAPIGLLVLALVGVLGSSRRRTRRPGPGLSTALLAASLALPGPAQSSLVVDLGVTDLAAGAERIVLADVVSVESRFDGIVRRAVTLGVVEDWAGQGEATVVLDLLGGELEEPVIVFGADGSPLPKALKGTRVFGVPDVVEGDRVVVVLDDSGVRGLAQGLFHVTQDGAVSRDLSGLALARTGGAPPRPVSAPDTLAQLREALRR